MQPEVKRYRKKPVEIEAVECAYPNLPMDIVEWIGPDASVIWPRDPDTQAQLVIRTLEGEMIAREGDFVIKGVNGEFYPCKPNIFAKTYDKLEA